MTEDMKLVEINTRYSNKQIFWKSSMRKKQELGMKLKSMRKTSKWENNNNNKIKMH